MFFLVWHSGNSAESAPAAPQMIEADFVVGASKPVAPVALVVDEPVATSVLALDQPSANVIETLQPLLEVETGSVVDDRQFILAQSPNSYTMQIMGLSSLDAIGQYKQALSQYMTPKWLATIRNNQPWFVLFSGVYATREQAQWARNRLPQPLINQKPWIRQFSEVQRQIIENQ